MKINRNNNSIYLYQLKYTRKILEKYNTLDLNLVLILLIKIKLVKNKGQAFKEEIKLYQ